MTCTSCDTYWYKKTFSGGVKSYDACWSLLKLLGIMSLLCCLGCCSCALCYFCYRRGILGKGCCEFSIGGNKDTAYNPRTPRRQNPVFMTPRRPSGRKTMYLDSTTSRQSIASMQTQRVMSPRLVARPRVPQPRLVPVPQATGQRVAPRMGLSPTVDLSPRVVNPNF